MTQPLEIAILPSLAAISAQDWDACANPDGGRPEDPFTTHRFLLALEESGSVGPGTGWEPHYLTVRDDGALIAVAPLYAKSHSQGEYIFDHNFAEAYARAGGQYYPKLQIAVPFTPVTGRRFLTVPGRESDGTAALIDACQQIMDGNGLSSIHTTFCTAEEAARGEAMGLLHRVTQQYHWENKGYADFEAFLTDLSSRKRKAIRKERRTAQGFGGEIAMLTGDDLTPTHWDAMWHFYQDTGARKWGQPYLTRAFFDLAAERLADDVVMGLALRDGAPVAGALNFRGRSRLYGRYWGASGHHPCLHFELCYYQAIEWAIAHQLSTVEAGAQGDHKLARGYLPVETHSLHGFREPAFARAVEDYLVAERDMMREDIEVVTAYGPFRRTSQEEQE
ncbi:MAG: GNAT family N-acetyltransferase [Rhodobacterales bacterium]|nr:MAG: GNAT family N-acetyltransferase [Rhodobacterales bacterium]